ncbi:centrosomal protein kizuna isoform X2 [Perognathus longimembris pacificus]|uniref:centrosomal protein kizuna isoform X2 n=1 Tax=Perognathus longimembris pacificus TaxID=214514 RepID=UPI00201999E6|nr:centrosomal protein kizuna isoform X2 [Perognathus longimembris pacificus]
MVGRGGNMQPFSASSASQSNVDYYQRVGQLQHQLRVRVNMKYVKLKKYLKEICESEKRAHIRNQEYLKQFERFQVNVGRFATNPDKLQKLKIEYETRIKNMQLLSKNSLETKDELKDEDREKEVIQTGIKLGTSMSRGLYQPATVFMGRQMSAISSIGDFSTEQKSPQPTKNFSIPDPHSHQQTAQSSNVTDSYVVQTNSDTQYLNKTDKIDGKTSLQIGEKMPVTASLLSEEEQTHCLQIGSSTCHSKNNLSESKKSSELHSSLQERLSPKNRTTDLKCDSSSRSEGSEGEILTQKHTEVKEERTCPPVSAISVSEHCASENKWSQEKHSAWEGFSDHLAHGSPKSQRPFIKMLEEQEEESSCSSNDLTISLSENDSFLENLEPQPFRGDKMKREDSKQENNVLSTENKNCDPKKESSTDLPTRQSDQTPDWGLLKSQLGQHIATLKEGDNSLEEEATALLKKAPTEESDHRSAIHSNESSCSLPSILNDNSAIKEAKPPLWLNSVHTREQDVSSDCGDESKEESISAKVPITETKTYQLLKKSTLLDNTNQNEEKFQKDYASGPQFSSLNIGSSTLKTKTTHNIASEASFSSSEGSPLSRHEDEKKLMTNLKSNAFWGESDDSNSEIEAALRPKNHSTSIDDFDDFYDT